MCSWQQPEHGPTQGSAGACQTSPRLHWSPSLVSSWLNHSQCESIWVLLPWVCVAASSLPRSLRLSSLVAAFARCQFSYWPLLRLVVLWISEEFGFKCIWSRGICTALKVFHSVYFGKGTAFKTSIKKKEAEVADKITSDLWYDWKNEWEMHSAEWKYCCKLSCQVAIKRVVFRWRAKAFLFSCSLQLDSISGREDVKIN